MRFALFNRLSVRLSLWDTALFAVIGGTLKELDVFPTPEEAPEFYTDFDETGPFTAEVGDSECAV